MYLLQSPGQPFSFLYLTPMVRYWYILPGHLAIFFICTHIVMSQKRMLVRRKCILICIYVCNDALQYTKPRFIAYSAVNTIQIDLLMESRTNICNNYDNGTQFCEKKMMPYHLNNFLCLQNFNFSDKANKSDWQPQNIVIYILCLISQKGNSLFVSLDMPYISHSYEMK